MVREIHKRLKIYLALAALGTLAGCAWSEPKPEPETSPVEIMREAYRAGCNLQAVEHNEVRGSTRLMCK